MPGLLIGYARVLSAGQDLASQRVGLGVLGVNEKRAYVDHGLIGTSRERPGLREAQVGCRECDTLVVAKLDCLARSVPDARDVADEFSARGVQLNSGGSVHDCTHPVGGLLLTAEQVHVCRRGQAKSFR